MPKRRINLLSVEDDQEISPYSAVERVRLVTRWMQLEQDLHLSVLPVSCVCFVLLRNDGLFTITMIGQCREYVCTAPDAVGPGGTCTADYDCNLTRDSCLNGICTDVGTSCTAADGSSTGVSDTCDAGTSTLDFTCTQPIEQ